mgnify:FL=1
MYKGSTNQKSGEAMVKPEKKLKKVLLILGITGAVYGGFRYLLPLVIPFLLAYATAVWLRPSVRFLERRLKWDLRGKEFCVPGWLIGAAELLLLFAGIIFLFYLGGRMFFAQIRSFISQIPFWANRLEEWVTAVCLRLEAAFGFSAGFLSDRVGSVAEELMEAARTATMPALMDQSVQAVGKLAGGLVFFFIYFIAVILCLQEMEELRERKSRSVFHRELSLLGRRLVAVGNAWLRTQLLLFFLVSLICMAGLLLLGNSYFLLLGPVIGLVDALPVFGAGTVLIPWFLLSFLQGRWGQGVVLLFLYLVCYLLRQVAEARLMGGQVGLTALETLFSMYVGLRLFGIAGFLLGPIGFLMIEDLLRIYGGPSGNPRRLS